MVCLTSPVADVRRNAARTLPTWKPGGGTYLIRQTLGQPLETVRGQLSVRLPFRPGAKTVSDSVGDGITEGDKVDSAEGLTEGPAEAVGDGDGEIAGEGETVGEGDAVSVLTSGTETSKPTEVKSLLVL